MQNQIWNKKSKAKLKKCLSQTISTQRSGTFDFKHFLFVPILKLFVFIKDRGSVTLHSCNVWVSVLTMTFVSNNQWEMLFTICEFFSFLNILLTVAEQNIVFPSDDVSCTLIDIN